MSIKHIFKVGFIGGLFSLNLFGEELHEAMAESKSSSSSLNAPGIGLRIGLSGLGGVYRQHFENGLGVQIRAGVETWGLRLHSKQEADYARVSNQIIMNCGVNGMYTLHRSSLGRIYGLLGATTYYSSFGDFSVLSAGIGAGAEVYFSGRVGLAFELPMVALFLYKSSLGGGFLGFLPTISGTLSYYF